MRFLLDANLSPQTANYLSASLGLDVSSLLATNQGTLTDAQVVELAKEQHRVIVTCDLDFGEIYFTRERGKIGVIILRLDNQTVESINRVLTTFFRDEADSIDLDHSLVVIEEHRLRIRSATS